MHPRMQDLLLNLAPRLTLVGTISVLVLACLILGNCALFELINGKSSAGGTGSDLVALAARGA